MIKKVVIAVCKENGDGKLTHVEANKLLDHNSVIETVEQVIKNIGNGEQYIVSKPYGQKVEVYDHEDRIRSVRNGKDDDNLRNLPISKKCKNK